MKSKAQSIYLSGVVNRSYSRSLSKTQNGRFLLNFGVRKKFQKSKFINELFQLGSVYYIFALECTVLAQINKV